MSVSATVGDETTTVDVNEYNDSNTVIELDWADYIEVTGVAAAPTADAAAEEAPAADAAQGLSTGAIIAIAAVCVVIVAAVVVVLTKKKKNA